MGRHANGWERKRPEGWKEPFHYSYHNRPFIERLLALYHGTAKPRAGVLPWDLSKALKSARKQYAKFCGNTSKYVPHQGEREMSHRRARLSTPAFSLR